MEWQEGLTQVPQAWLFVLSACLRGTVLLPLCHLELLVHDFLQPRPLPLRGIMQCLWAGGDEDCQNQLVCISKNDRL